METKVTKDHWWMESLVPWDFEKESGICEDGGLKKKKSGPIYLMSPSVIFTVIWD